jgi:membrane protein YdbS with pleckstrin-like domain
MIQLFVLVVLSKMLIFVIYFLNRRHLKLLQLYVEAHENFMQIKQGVLLVDKVVIRSSRK